MPLAKYSLALSALRFSNGSTAIDLVEKGTEPIKEALIGSVPFSSTNLSIAK